jgi:hypothetical protein
MGVGGDGSAGLDGDRIIDNMKVYNYQKTTFEDRFTEGIGAARRR